MNEESNPNLEKSLIDKIKNLLTPVGVFLALIFKFGAKLKLLAFPLLKFLPIILKSGGTMLFTVWAYSLFWGWKFALGFVILILIHESGHLFFAKLFNLDVGLPVFIPFLGAFVALKEAPKSAWVEFWVAAGGPIVGGLAALFCHFIYFEYNSQFFGALAYIGYFLNIFNLLPTGTLDGGRMAVAISPWLWVAGIVIACSYAYYNPSFIIFLIILFSLPRLFSLFKEKTDEEKRFFEISRSQRLIASSVYFGLVIILSSGMANSMVNIN